MCSPFHLLLSWAGKQPMADFGHILKMVSEAMGSHTGVNELEGGFNHVVFALSCVIVMFCKVQVFELMYFLKMREERHTFCLKKQLFRIALSGDFPGCYKSNTVKIKISGGF